MQSYGIAKSSTFSRIENCYIVMVQDSGRTLISTNNYSVNFNNETITGIIFIADITC